MDLGLRGKVALVTSDVQILERVLGKTLAAIRTWLARSPVRASLWLAE